MTGQDEIKESDTVRDGNRRIARKTSEVAYSRDSERSRNIKIVDGGNSVEYN